MLINLGFGIGPTMYALNHADPTTTILAFCKMRIYVLQSSSMMYRWAFTVACFDRYALSSASVRLRNFARVHIARRVVTVIVCLWLVLPVHGPIFYQISASGCGIFNNKIAALYHSIFTTMNGCIFPIVIMIICTLLIYRNLVLKRQRRQVHDNRPISKQNEINRSQRARDQQVLIMLLVQVFVYIISITPLMIMFFYNAITQSVTNKSVDRVTIEKFASYISEVIVYLFPVLSFYLYTMASNIFRNELKRLLYSVFTCRWNNIRRIEPTTNDVQLRTVTTAPQFT
jgi:small-conductance mechanosensitive channel